MNETVIRDARVYCAQGPQQLDASGIGILSGISFVFKDLFDVQGYVTGAGNPAWLASHAPAQHSSPIIERLRAHGANCVGRVQTDELAYSLNGQNTHYGTPVNPLAPDCIPGGSSSGSAVAVANGDADFALGTDTGGSVRVPASYCGLFGLRPTHAKLNLSHCFELASSFDTAGVLSADLHLLSDIFSVLSATPVEGNATRKLYLDNSLAMQLSEQRLTTLQKWCRDALIELHYSDLLIHSGYDLDELSLLFRTIQGFEIIQQHSEWLYLHGDSLDPAIMQRVDWAREISRAQYESAKVEQQRFQRHWQEQLSALDGLWILPTTPAGPPALDMEADKLATYRSQLMGLTSIAGLSGFPQLHLPMQGLAEGPCGISLMGINDSENSLICTGLTLWQGAEE